MSDNQIGGLIALLIGLAFAGISGAAVWDGKQRRNDCRATLAIARTSSDTIAVLRVYPYCTAVLPTPTERR